MRFVVLAVWPLLAAAPLPAAADSAGPVWAVSKGAGTVYLAGSVHVLDSANDTLPPGFDIAYADAERIVMELDLDDLDPMIAQSFLLENGTLPEGQSLRDVLGPDRYKRIEATAGNLGLPLAAFQQLEPWTVVMMLTQLQLAKLGLDPENGVEKQIQRRAQQDAKSIDGLETIEEQLAVLDGLSYPDQAKFLELTAEEGEEMPQELRTMLAAWRDADMAELEQLLLDEYAKLPSLYGPLVTDRNRRWLPAIEALLTRKDDTLVVVGALHLVGPDGLLALLAKRGVKPVPVTIPARGSATQ